MSEFNLYKSSENIVAEMTPPGRGAVSAIRISGSDVKSIVEDVFGFKPDKPRHSYFINHRLDDIVLVYYKAPESYTGEDVCEIFCHGNPQIVNSIIDLILSYSKDFRSEKISKNKNEYNYYSIRMATPGEFTKRAYLNGKMDLLQAESVAELINSNTAVSVGYNAKTLRGELSGILEDIKSSLTHQAVHSELEIDFEDDAEPIFSYKNALKIAKEKHSIISNICSNFATIERISKDTQVVIHGPVNVGKSSLFNRLLNMNRSITHHEPGTTRDYIEARVIWDGLDLVLVDTAGIREDSNCKVENEGIARVKELIDDDTIIIEVTDNENFDFRYNNSIKVMNKIDLCNPKKHSKDIIYVSATRNTGIDKIRSEIVKRVIEKNKVNQKTETAFLATKRQKLILNELNTQLAELINEITNEKPVDIISFRINKCIASINTLLGLEHSADSILDELFSKFCIGK